MGDELATLMDMFQSIQKAGRSATLTMSTREGKATKVKLEFELDDTKPSPLSTSSASSASSPSLPSCKAAAAGDRHRHRGSAARRAKANARAAQHRGFQALPFPGGDYSAALGPPDPSPPQPRQPLHLHPSPKEENRRLIVKVDRKAGFQPSFSQLDGDEDPPASPSTSPTFKPLVDPPSTPPPLSPAPLSNDPPQPQLCSSPLPPPCFPDPHPLCCHCTGTCPCSWGAPCRRCPGRTGRHHVCDWCPGSWCKWAPVNHPIQMRSPLRKSAPRYLLEQPMVYNDKY